MSGDGGEWVWWLDESCVAQGVDSMRREYCEWVGVMQSGLVRQRQEGGPGRLAVVDFAEIAGGGHQSSVSEYGTDANQVYGDESGVEWS